LTMNHDRIITDLLNAMGAIRWAAQHRPPSDAAPYIDGLAEQAIANATAQMTRNADGYLVAASPARPSTETESSPEPPKVINLMDALRKALDSVNAHRKTAATGDSK
jgi:hypothetical protein